MFQVNFRCYLRNFGLCRESLILNTAKYKAFPRVFCELPYLTDKHITGIVIIFHFSNQKHMNIFNSHQNMSKWFIKNFTIEYVNSRFENMATFSKMAKSFIQTENRVGRSDLVWNLCSQNSSLSVLCRRSGWSSW